MVNLLDLVEVGGVKTLCIVDNQKLDPFDARTC